MLIMVRSSSADLPPEHSADGEKRSTDIKRVLLLGYAQFKEEDIAHSLLYSITDQLTQTTYLTAKAEGLHRAIFCGSYLSANTTIIQQITSKLAHCALYLKHEVSPVFLRYEGYLGAIGALFDGRITLDSEELTKH
ncbi:hypothetical protein LSH36_499g00000 [Paralvinella palmiformis]|uniref:Uncharacterized protein n=1 Tax=Paralvinella palmiformis TaxID=53620 RepID=A0AAD9MWV4_9ANNE|nr:hypothetical protein LSH36_499g00000 [Paralvinella palmiformis]